MINIHTDLAKSGSIYHELVDLFHDVRELQSGFWVCSNHPPLVYSVETDCIDGNSRLLIGQRLEQSGMVAIEPLFCFLINPDIHRAELSSVLLNGALITNPGEDTKTFALECLKQWSGYGYQQKCASNVDLNRLFN
jgi:hypothetical protein